MIFSLGFLLVALNHVHAAEIKYVAPEFLSELRTRGKDELFAKYLGLPDVSLVRPQEGRTAEIELTNVSPLGDILLTPEQEEQARQGINFIRIPTKKWQDNVIPYAIAENEFDPSDVSTIKNAIEALNRRTGKLKIAPRKNEKDYVMVMNGNGCWSYLGKTDGQQGLSLQSNGCLRTGTIQHEFMHAAGLAHEHCRPDRDDSVEIQWNNISRDWRSQYQKVSSNDFDSIRTYDYYSVMHYGMTAPGTRKLAFKFYDSSVDTRRVGQRNGPSNEDILKINYLYP